jgi:hypothetical protein
MKVMSVPVSCNFEMHATLITPGQRLRTARRKYVSCLPLLIIPNFPVQYADAEILKVTISHADMAFFEFLCLESEGNFRTGISNSHQVEDFWIRR